MCVGMMVKALDSGNKLSGIHGDCTSFPNPTAAYVRFINPCKSGRVEFFPQTLLEIRQIPYHVTTT